MKLAIDLGGTNIRIGQIANGVILKKIVIPCPSKESYQEVLSQIESLIEQMMNKQIEGIGIGVPSVVNSEKGIVYNVANIPSWKEVHLKKVLQDRFSVPVHVNNDSNCFTLGEKLFGEGIPFHNLVGVTLGTGVGTGIIVNDILYNGKNTGAGEIGSLPYLSYDFEHYCSSNFFERYHHLSGKEAAERAIKGDQQALNVWKIFGSHLGNLIKAILFTYDPEAIIIGGGIASAFPFFDKAMIETMNTFPYKETLNGVKIQISQKEDISLLGASALIV